MSAVSQFFVYGFSRGKSWQPYHLELSAKKTPSGAPYSFLEWKGITFYYLTLGDTPKMRLVELSVEEKCPQ
jgi:hypothetical protein